jgi:hypothetical protein
VRICFGDVFGDDSGIHRGCDRFADGTAFVRQIEGVYSNINCQDVAGQKLCVMYLIPAYDAGITVNFVSLSLQRQTQAGLS